MSNALNSLDCIVLADAWLFSNTLNYNMENVYAIKTNDNLFNQNSGLIVYINNKYPIENFPENFIDKWKYVHLKLGNYLKYDIIALY